MTTAARDRVAPRPLPRLSTWLNSVIDLSPHTPALHFSGTSHTWSYFADARHDLDTLLERHPRACRVGIVLRNRPGPLAAAVATIASGRQVVTLGPHTGDAALAEEIAEQRPDVVVADPQDWARPGVAEAVKLIGAAAAASTDERAVGPHPGTWEVSPACLPMEDTALSMTTSGTTGKPKRVSLTFAQLTSAFTAAGTSLDTTDTPRLRTGTVILWSPLTHISGLYFAISYAVEGRRAALLEKFDVEEWAGLVREHRPRLLRLPPTALRMVLDADLPPEVFDGVRAIGSGTAPLSPELRERFEQRYGVPVLVTYGATEFAGAVAGWTLRDHEEWAARKRGSVGRAHRGVELRVVDEESGEPRGPGQTGLLEVRGPQLSSAPGAWLRTNDLASLDEDGFLFIGGRADQAVNRGGFKIPPSVIEEALALHPAVTEAVAVGLSDDRLGEVPAAAVTLRSPATERELLDHLATRLTRYQMPVMVALMTEMPRTSSMKTSRSLVRERLLTERGSAAGERRPADRADAPPGSS